MANNSLTFSQLACEIEWHEMAFVASIFDDVYPYIEAMTGVTTVNQAEIKRSARITSIHVAVIKCLSIWKESDPTRATFCALLDILLSFEKGMIANNLCQYLAKRCT